MNQEATRGNCRVSLRSLLVLTAAWAYWIWLISDLRHELVALVLLATITMAAGTGAHLLYIYVLRWRGTAVVSLLVLPALFFSALAVLLGAGDGVVLFLSTPIDFFLHQGWSDRVRFTIPVFASALILAVAHPIKPSWITAIISAMGISLWYGVTLLILANAG
ncbi:MAG: hypothetical protein ACYC3X_26185 [Pirellulaceae bacterium]